MTQTHDPLPPPLTCVSCGSPVHGTYCSACGEKVLTAGDHSIRHFLSEWLELVFHVDSKFLRSLRLLLFFPGRMTGDYLMGRRNRCMRPFQLLIVLNVLYYLATSAGAHWGVTFRVMYPALDDLTTARIYSPWLASVVQARVAASALPWPEYQRAFNEQLEHLARSLVVLLAPMLAAILQLVYLRSRRTFLDHLVTGFHLVGFYIFFWSLVILAVAAATNLAAVMPHPAGYIPIVMDVSLLVLLVYIGVALRTVYRQPWWLTAFKTLLIVFLAPPVITHVYDLVLFGIAYVIV